MTGPVIGAKLRFVLDECSRALRVSDGLEGLLGYSAQDLMDGAIHLRDRIHAGDADIAQLLFSPPIEHQSGSVNVRLRHADGRIRLVRGEYRKTPSQADAPATLDLLLEDARSLWQGPDSVPASPTFCALMENTDDFIFSKDRNHVFTAASWTFLKPFASSGEGVEVLGMTDYELFPEKYADIYYRLEKDVFAGVAVASEVHESIKLDGSLAWLDNRKYPIRNAAGEITGLIGVVRDVSEQMRAQQAAVETEKKYRAIFDGAAEGIVRVTVDGRLTLANRAAAAILGYDSIDQARAEIQDVGNDVWVIPAERDAYVRRLVASENHAVIGFECRLKHRDGSALWVLLNGRMVYGEDGNPSYLDGFFVDITDRKQAAEALRASEESLRRAQAIARLGSYVGDLNTGDWTSSEILDEIFGIDKSYVRTKESWAARVHPDDREKMFAYLMNEIMGQKKAFDHQYRIVRLSDGAARWLQDRGEVEMDGLGRPVRMHGIVRDITETKLQEATLRESSDTLNEAQSIAGVGSYKLDVLTGAWTSSAVLDQIFGIGKDFVRTVAGWKTLVHPDDRAAMEPRVLAVGIRKGEPFDKEFRTVRASDGAVRWVHALGRMEFDALGRPISMVGTVQDITEKRLAEAALRESTESLKEAQRIARLGNYRLDVTTGQWTSSEVLDDLFGIGEDYEHTIAGWTALVHQDDRAAVSDHLVNEVLGRGAPFDKEYRIVRGTDGAVRWVHGQGRLEFAKDGRPVAMHGTIKDITDRRQNEIALREIAESLKEAQRIAGLGSTEIDIATRSSKRSDELNELLGIGAGFDNSTAGWHSLVHPEDRAMMAKHMAYEMRSSGETFDQEYRIIRPSDQAVRWMHARGQVKLDFHGKPEKLRITIQDITQRREAEAALRRSEESLKEAQRIAGLGSLEVDVATDVARRSDELNELLGIDGDYKLEYSSWLSLVHPDDRADMANHIAGDLESKGVPREFEHRIVRPSDGAMRWLRARSQTELDSAGRPCKLRVTMQDITERKLAEEALRESEESLKEAQAIAGVGSFVLDLKAGRVQWSEVLSNLLGIGADYDKSLGAWFDLVHPEDRASIHDAMAQAAKQDGEPVGLEYRIVRRSDQAIRWMRSRGRMEFDRDGNALRIRGTLQDITEQRQADAALRESQELLQLFIAHAPAGLAMLDREMRYLATSRRWMEMHLLPNLDVIGKSHYEVLPDLPESWKEEHRRGLAGEPLPPCERSLVRADGSVHWVRREIIPWRKADGTVGGIIIFSDDITWRRQAEESLRESRDVLQLFIAHAPVGLAMFDREMRYLATSRRWMEMHSLVDREIVGKSHYEIFPSLPPSWKEENQRALAGEHLPARERRLERADGSVQWMRREIIPWMRGDGTIGGIILLLDDITWRMEAEAALRESKEQLQLFIEAAPVALAMFDREMRYLTVSHRWARDRGFSAQQLIGRSHYEINPSLPEKWKETHRRGLAGERQRSDDDRFDQADGSIEWIQWEIIPWQAADGSVGGIIMFYEDITERKRAEATLRANADLLEMFIKRAPAALAMFDRDMRYLHASDRWLEEYGLMGREIVGHVHYEISPDIPERWREMHRRGLAGETLAADEDSYERADGKVCWIRWEVRPWRTGDGAVGGIILFAEDITGHKENEQRLQLSASVFTNAREGIMITDPKGKILEVNEMFTRITGYTREEAIGADPSMFKSGLQSDEFYATMWTSLIEEGQWSGEVWNRAKSGAMFAEMLTINAVRDAEGNVLQYVALFSDVTEIKEHERQLEHVTHYDMLTSLPNRALLADRLRQAMELPSQQNRLLAVAYLDLDNFKEVNDRYGHTAGDRLLTALAFNMKCALRKGDTLARLGGDEFVAVMLDLGDAGASVPVLNRLLEAAAEPVQVGETSLHLTASVGVAFYRQTDDVDADSLVRQADQAMYQAKLTGGNRYHVYDPDHDQLVRGRHENLEHIRNALAAREFVLYYQPKVNMRTGKVVGAEALIRWQHPERGLLPPGMFLPVIDEDLLAVEVGEWVIATALTQMEAWSSEGLEIPVSVNVGALQLQQPDFVSRLAHLLSAHPNVKPFSLELEVLETSALHDVVQTSQVLNSCHEIGVAFALDDFGTGYSSLTYLKRLPVNMLKIDQSFVSDMLDDPENLNILEGVLGLAAAFHRNVIAEGVETVEHGLMLLQLGCELAQGYGIARPMPARDMSAWVAGWRPDPRWAQVPLINAANRALLYAAVEHRAWVAAFEAYLQGKRHAPPSMDLRRCRLGIWLESERLAGRDKLPAYSIVESVHRRFHELATEIFSVVAGGKGSDGLGQLGELHRLRDELLRQLEAMRKEV